MKQRIKEILIYMALGILIGSGGSFIYFEMQDENPSVNNTYVNATINFYNFSGELEQINKSINELNSSLGNLTILDEEKNRQTEPIYSFESNISRQEKESGLLK